MLCAVLATTAVTARDIYVYTGGGKSVAHIDAQKLTFTSDAEIASMSVYSAMGTMVKAVKPNGPVATISLDDLDTGIYIVQVKTGATVVTKKIIKR